MRSKRKILLDEEEKEVLEAYERGELKPNADAKELARYQAYAKTSLAKKDKRINIRLSSHDLEAIQVLAVEEGIPYQTLIASVLHKFATGRLVDKRSDTSVPG
ncbi:antitoxin [cyanobacterium TDX16]|nr:antitoxin [cyanobacterium TDX16]